MFKYQVHHTLINTCVNCTFLDNDSTGCVAVVHQRISQLSSSGLMNIELSHKFNRSGDTVTVYGCIGRVNTTLYQIGVFSLVEVASTPPSSKHHSFCVQVDISLKLFYLRKGPGHVLEIGIIVTIVGKVYIILYNIMTCIYCIAGSLANTKFGNPWLSIGIGKILICHCAYCHRHVYSIIGNF